MGTGALPSKDRNGQLSDGSDHVVREKRRMGDGDKEGGNQRGKSITAQIQGGRLRIRRQTINQEPLAAAATMRAVFD